MYQAMSKMVTYSSQYFRETEIKDGQVMHDLISDCSKIAKKLESMQTVKNISMLVAFVSFNTSLTK